MLQLHEDTQGNKGKYAAESVKTYYMIKILALQMNG